MKYSALILVTILALCGCKSNSQSGMITPISGYAFLNTPVGEGMYRVGCKWITGVGTDGDPIVKVNSSGGPELLNATETSTATFSLDALLKIWASAKFGIKETEIKKVTLRNISHTYVTDYHGIKSNCKLLAEIISADGIDISVNKQLEINNQVGLAELQKYISTNGEVKIGNSLEDNSTISIKSQKRLIIAVKVVEIKHTFETEDVQISVHNQFKRKLQKIPFNYDVVVSEVNYIENQFKIILNNNKIPSFISTELNLNPGLNWSYKNSQTFACDKAFVQTLDKMRVLKEADVDHVWNLEITRQNIKILPTDELW